MTIPESTRPTNAPAPDNGDDRTSRGRNERRVAVLVNGEQTAGRFALIETIEVRGTELPRHRHHREDEALYVLEGTLRLVVGDAWTDLTAGTAVVLPRGVDHAAAVVGRTARVLTILAPAGAERFFAEAAETSTDGTGREIERLIALAARVGREITGPPATGPIAAGPSRGRAGRPVSRRTFLRRPVARRRRHR